MFSVFLRMKNGELLYLFTTESIFTDARLNYLMDVFGMDIIFSHE